MDCRPDLLAVPPAAPRGADLAARARFVAMAFSTPDTGAARFVSATSPLQMTTSPLTINCQPTRVILTLGHAALHYRLQLGNRGAEALGPLIIRADLATAGLGIPPDHPAIFDPEELPLCHYLDSLPAGGTTELSGELPLSLANIAAIRLGTAELLAQLMRVGVESAGGAVPGLSSSACFAIGVPAASTGGEIAPL